MPRSPLYYFACRAGTTNKTADAHNLMSTLQAELIEALADGSFEDEFSSELGAAALTLGNGGWALDHSTSYATLSTFGSSFTKEVEHFTYSEEPTSLPTPNPTTLPSPLPTTAPTSLPTLVPTATPTTLPTPTPTTLPTATPTTLPTPTPTAMPTTLPTSLPTAVPTTLPTALPTTPPTTVPTALPTSLPTAVPTTLPTALPTALPTSLPTSLPTPLPTPAPVAGVLVTAPARHTVDEAGEVTSSFEISLITEPLGIVYVKFTSLGNTAMEPAVVEFDYTNFDSPQAVTVSAVNDWIDQGDWFMDHIDLNFTSTDECFEAENRTLPCGQYVPYDGFDGVNSADGKSLRMDVNVTDDDTASVAVTQTFTNTTINNYGDVLGEDTYGLRLTSEPRLGVTVDLSMVGTYSSFSHTDVSSVTFTADNWNTTQYGMSGNQPSAHIPNLTLISPSYTNTSPAYAYAHAHAHTCTNSYDQFERRD